VHKPWKMATGIGSLPFKDSTGALDLIFANLTEAPHWPQLPALSARENILNQFVSPLLKSGLVHTVKDKYVFATGSDEWENNVLRFYEKVLSLEADRAATAINDFSFPEDAATGFYAFLEALDRKVPDGIRFLKGQVCGPVTLGLQLFDRQGLPGFYDDELRNIITNQLACQALWQHEKLKKYGYPVIIFIDDPAIVSYGQSTTVGLSGGQITESLALIIKTVQEAGGLAGVHVCAGIDWSLVFDAAPDIISFDAYGYFPSLLLYAEQLTVFLERGGALSWGLIPTQGEREDVERLRDLFYDRIRLLARRGVPQRLLENQWLMTPSCGAGSLSINEAVAIYSLTKNLAEAVRN